MDTLRKRIPFKGLSEEDSNEVGRVLDEQEQEEVLEKLKEKAIKSSSDYLQVLQAVIGVSFFLHLMFFVDPSPESVLVPFFPTTPPEAPIPLTRLFTLIQILIHVNLLLHIIPEQPWLRDVPNVPLPVIWVFSLSTLAPSISVLLGRHWQQTLWWSVTPVISGIIYLRLYWNEEGQREIRELEKMKYEAKGA